MSRGTRRSGPRPERRSAFTLIEVVVTLAIVALAAVVAVPAFLGEPEPSELDAAAERFESLLTLARDSAVSSATPIRVVVDSASGRAWLTGGRSVGVAPASTTPGGSVSFELSRGVQMISSSARSQFLFQPGGSAFPDSVMFTDGTGSRLITLNPLTGHVLVLR